MKKTVLDLEHFPRKAHFDYFRSLRDPYVGVTVPVDVTELTALCKRQGWSFYLLFLHAAALAADRVAQLRQRITEDGGIVQFDACPTSHTELLDNGAYCYCTLRHDPAQPIGTYLAYAEAERSACRERASIEEDEDVLAEYFISTLPWLPYSDLRQPTGGESNPHISWGRFTPDSEGRLEMPVTLLCHHALVDGIHLAQFYQALDTVLAELTAEG